MGAASARSNDHTFRVTVLSPAGAVIPNNISGNVAVVESGLQWGGAATSLEKAP